MKILRSVFEDARRDGYISDNPAKDCGTLKKQQGATRRPFTVEKIRAVLAVADAEWRSMILCGLYTGQRLGDIATLTWANVDLLAGEIHLRTAKTGRAVRIPLCKPLLEHIESLPAGDDPKAPFPDRLKQTAKPLRRFPSLSKLESCDRKHLPACSSRSRGGARFEKG